jgi:hypothetical protein
MGWANNQFNKLLSLLAAQLANYLQTPPHETIATLPDFYLDALARAASSTGLSRFLQQ